MRLERSPSPAKHSIRRNVQADLIEWPLRTLPSGMSLRDSQGSRKFTLIVQYYTGATRNPLPG